jgi:hypothetical protein
MTGSLHAHVGCPASAFSFGPIVHSRHVAYYPGFALAELNQNRAANHDGEPYDQVDCGCLCPHFGVVGPGHATRSPATLGRHRHYRARSVRRRDAPGERSLRGNARPPSRPSCCAQVRGRSDLRLTGRIPVSRDSPKLSGQRHTFEAQVDLAQRRATAAGYHVSAAGDANGLFSLSAGGRYHRRTADLAPGPEGT